MGDLVQAARVLGGLWLRLAQANNGAKGNGHPSPKSRPPASLAGVQLVLEVTGAAREGALELCAKTYRNVPDNLLHIATVLEEQDPYDLREWWTGALYEWTHRARVVLGEDPQLMRDIYGARCPECMTMFIMLKVAGEVRLTPTLGVIWREEPNTGDWTIFMVHCRSCAKTWHAGALVDSIQGGVGNRN